MNTPTHALLNSVVLTKVKSDNNNYGLWIIAGGFAPDLFVFSYAIYGLIMRIPANVLWDEMYFSQPLFSYISLTHSLIIFPILAIVFAYLSHLYRSKGIEQLEVRFKALTLFFTSWSMHIVVDFFVHADDAYKNFWPLSQWRFQSPVSYYDPRFYGQWFGLFETALFLALIVYVTKRYFKSSSMIAKIGICAGWVWAALSVVGQLVYVFLVYP